MRTHFVTFVMIALLCLALAPCVPARPQPSCSDADSNLVDTRLDDRTPPTPSLAARREFLNPLASESPGLERRSLKKSSSSGSKSKPYKSYKPHKTKAFHWSGQPPSLWGVVIGVSIVLGVFALCFVFVIVTEEREKDPNWRVRTFVRRRLKPQYTIKGIKAGKSRKAHQDIDMEKEKPNVEKKLPEAGDFDAALDTIKAPPA